jgi:hypothetical protein
MNLRPYKTPLGRKGITMRNSSTRQNLLRIGKRRENWDSRIRGLNPQDLRTMGKALRQSFPLKVCINLIFHIQVEINPLDKSQERLTTKGENH